MNFKPVLKLFSGFIISSIVIFANANLTYAAAITWDGGGSDGTCGGGAGDGNKWSCAANWSGDVVPTAADDVTFDSTSTKDATIDSSRVVDSLTIASTYSGTITQASGATFEADQAGTAFSQAGGTFTGGNSNILISGGSFSLSGGTFTSTSASLRIEANFTITSGTYNHNSGLLDSYDANNSIYSCNSATIPRFASNKNSATYSITIGSNCTLTLDGTNPTSVGSYTNNGSLIVTGNWTVSSYTHNSGATLTHSGTTLTINNTLGDLIINASGIDNNITTFDVDDAFTLGASATVPSSLTTVYVAGNLDNSNNILPNGLTTYFDGSNNGTITCGTATFANSFISKNSGTYSLIFGSSCNITLNGTNPTSVGSITNNGSITVTGNWTVNNYTHNAGATLVHSGTTLTVDQFSGDITINGSGMASNITTIDTGDDLAFGASGVAPSSLSTLYIGGDLDNTNNKLPNGLSVTLDASNSGTVTCGNATFGSFYILKNSSSYTMTIGSSCNITLAGTNPTSTGTVSNSGTINVTGNWTVHGYTQNSGGSLVMSGTTFTVSSVNLTLNSGTLPSNITTIAISQGNLTLSGGTIPSSVTSLSVGGNLTDASGTIPPTTDVTMIYTSGTITCGNNDLQSLTINRLSFAYTTTIADNCTIGNFTISSGAIGNPATPMTYTVTGNFAHNQTGATVGGSNFTIKLNGTGTQTVSATGTGTFSSPIEIDKASGEARLTTNFTSGSTCTLTNGTFNYNGYALTCSSAITASSGTTIKVIGNEILTQFPTMNSGSTLEITGNGDSTADTFILNDGISFKNLSINTTDSSDVIRTTASFLDTNLVGYWKMEEGSGSTVDDASSNNNVGSITNATFSTTKPTTKQTNNYAMSFDGSGDYINPGANLTIAQNKSAVSLSAWIRKNTNSGSDDIVGLSNGTSTSSDRAVLYTSSTFVLCAGRAGDSEANQTATATTTTLSTGTWYHIVCTIDYANDEIKIYINGIPQTTTGTIAFTATATSNTASQTSAIGIDQGKVSNSFDGYIDEVRIYDRELTATEAKILGGGYNGEYSQSTITAAGNFTLASGTLISPTTLNVSGNWAKTGGTFTPNSGTVVLNGSSQTISGSTTFYNLTKSVSTADTLTFTAGTTQTITNTLALDGDPSQLLSLRSSSTGSQWSIDPQSTRTLQYLDVKDSNNTNATAIPTTGLNVTNSGNNTNWDFGPVPEISLTALSPDPNSDTTPTLSGTTTDSNGTIASVQFQMDGTGGAWSNCTADDGTFDEATETFTCTSGSLSDGSHTMYARSTDNDGGVSSNASDTFSIDTTAPGVSLTALSPDPNSDTTPSLTGTSTDTYSNISNIQYQVDSTAGAWSNCTSDDGAFDETSESFTCTTSTLSNGSHTLYIKATDALSNATSSGYQSDTFTIDDTAPSVSVTALSPDPNTDSTPTLTGTVSDTYSNISNLQYQMDGTGGAWSSCTAGDGAFDETSETFSCTSNSLSDGSHTMYFKATDATGNATSSGYQSDTFTIDTTAPSVSVTAYTPDPTTDNTPTITGSVTDLTTTVSNLQYQTDSTAGAWSNCSADDSTFDEASETFSCTIASLGDGSHTIYFKATDAVSNATSSGYQSDSLTVDTTAPTDPGTPAATTASDDNTPTWAWTQSTDATVGLSSTTAYTLQWSQSSSFSSGNSTDTVGTSACSAGTCSFTHSTTLADGAWYFRVKTADILGNETSYSSAGNITIATITADSTPPTGSIFISIGSDNNPQQTSTKEITVNLSASDDQDSTNQLVMRVSETSSFDNAVWESYATTKALTLSGNDGTVTIYAQFKDTNNNQSTSYTDTIVLDTTKPNDFSLERPENNTYTSSQSFSFRFSTSSDATTGINKYKVIVDGETWIDDINPNKPNDSDKRVDEDKEIKYQDGYITVKKLGKNNDLDEGKHTWKVKAYDMVDNERTSDTRTVTVDFTKPELTLTQVDNQKDLDYTTTSPGKVVFSTSSLTPTLAGTSDAKNKIEIIIDENTSSEQKCETTADSDSSWECKLKKISTGRHTVKISAQDLAENTSELQDFYIYGGSKSLITEITKITEIQTETPPTEEPEVEIPLTQVEPADIETETPPTESPKVEESENDVPPIKLYTVQIKLNNKDGQPLANTKVTLFSTPKETTTDENGLAIFNEVPEGEHTLIVNDHKDAVGEQKILVKGDSNTIHYEVKVSPANPFFNWQVQTIIGLLISIIIFLAYKLFNRPH